MSNKNIFAQAWKEVVVDSIGFPPDDLPSPEQPSTWEFNNAESSQIEALRNLIAELNSDEAFSAKVIEENHGRLCLVMEKGTSQAHIPFLLENTDLSMSNFERGEFVNDPEKNETGYIIFDHYAFPQSPNAEKESMDFTEQVASAGFNQVPSWNSENRKAHFDLTNDKDFDLVKESIFFALANEVAYDLKAKAIVSNLNIDD